MLTVFLLSSPLMVNFAVVLVTTKVEVAVVITVVTDTVLLYPSIVIS